MYDYDLFVIGTGPGGQRAAVQAAKLGKRVGVAEAGTVIGGICIGKGTIPSKTLREAALYLSGYRERNFYGASYSVKEKITMGDLLHRTDFVIRTEMDVVRHQLQRNGIDLHSAKASFADGHTIRLESIGDAENKEITADKLVIAVGTNAARDQHIPFDGQRIFTSDDILELKDLPRSMAVIGGGVIGVEFATIFAILGVRVTLVDARPRLLDFVDAEVIDSLVYNMRRNRVTLRLAEEVMAVEEVDNERGEQVRIKLKSGKQISAEKALYSIGRQGATDGLNLGAAGLNADKRGRVGVNEHFQTDVGNIYAVGDVIGFPSLASTSSEQGRLAACHAFGVHAESIPDLFPYGIYSVPEISMVGKGEEELTEEGVPYEIGKAEYSEIARGTILGDFSGMLKLIFHAETKTLLGVCIIGEGASELIHIGQAVLAMNGKIDYFIDTVFNYPTLAECYKTAAFDGVNRLG
ncbi:MAG: putative soluble pyridine nucleotide transhydrogenase [Alphaproteobacteria bacterium MarineAlpha4_Bin2]|nr:MAG: putative soluble pyridine nucleotide transhydrogenase [Alphaproteobacteria bacterium MarineAlpha4_Bin2]